MPNFKKSVRFLARHKLLNCSWWQVSSSFEISNLSKTVAVIFLFLQRFPFANCFVLSPNLDWCAARLNSVHIMEEVIWNKRTLKSMEVDLHSSQSENESGTKCWLTNLFNLSLQQFYLEEENLKMFYNLKGLHNEGLRGQMRYWIVWLNPIINYSTPFPNINLLLSLRYPFTIRFWNIFMNLYTVHRLRNKQKHKESFKYCLRVFKFRD